MDWIRIVLLFLFAIACIGLILFVLIQQPKQSGLSSNMGTGKEFFGGRGFDGGLIKITCALGAAFLLLAFVLVKLSS